MIKRWFGFVLFALLLFTLSACSEDTSSPNSSTGDEPTEEKEYTFKIAHETPETHIKHLVATKFKEELESKSEGRLKVDIFPAAQLGGDKDLIQQIETGTLDFAMINNASLSSQAESMNGWFMPFLFDSLENAAEARKGDAAKQMLKELESQGIIGFDVFFAGARHILLEDGQVESFAGLQGKKLRVPGSPVFEEFWSKVGAGPTAMPLGEVYTALQTGVINGIDTDLDALLSKKFFEIAKSLTLTNHMAFPEVAMGSKQVFDKLTEKDQQLIVDAMNVAIEWGIEEAIKLENSRIEDIKANGVTVTELSDSEIDNLQPIIDEMYEKYAQQNEVIKAFIEENK